MLLFNTFKVLCFKMLISNQIRAISAIKIYSTCKIFWMKCMLILYYSVLLIIIIIVLYLIILKPTHNKVVCLMLWQFSKHCYEQQLILLRSKGYCQHEREDVKTQSVLQNGKTLLVHIALNSETDNKYPDHHFWTHFMYYTSQTHSDLQRHFKFCKIYY